MHTTFISQAPHIIESILQTINMISSKKKLPASHLKVVTLNTALIIGLKILN